jgi:Calx-beta domain-containing protein
MSRTRTVAQALRAPIAALLLVGSTAAATPVFADGGFVTLSGGSVTEGDAGQAPAVFTVSLSSPQSTPVTARFQAIGNHTTVQAGDATPGSGCTGDVDFIAVDGTVTIPANATQISVDVPVCGDLAIEGTETFTVLLSNVQGSFCLELCATHGTITDNDTAQPLPIVAPPSLSIANASVLEGDPLFTLAQPSRLNFVVTLSAASQSTVTVDYQTATKGLSNDATPGRICGFNVDYLSASGTLTFNPGETHKTITVHVCADNLPEANEILLVKLSNPTHATLNDALGIGTIINDD